VTKTNKLLILALVLGLAATNTAARAQFSEELQSDVSVRDLLEGYERNPKADTYYLMALSEARKNNIEAAEKAIKTGLTINPRNTRLLNLQGAIRARQGKLVEARRIFLNVLQLNPDDDYAQASLSSVERILQPRQRQVQVINQPQKPVEENAPASPVMVKPVQVEKKVLEASYFRQIKQKQQCYHAMASLKRSYESYLASNPKTKEFSPTEMVSAGFLTSVPLCPESGTYSYEDSDIVCSKHGKQSEIGAEVTTVFTDFNRGMRAKLSRNYLDALKAFEQVVVLYPRWAEAHYQLADTLFRLGETEPAILSLRNCLKHEPDNLDAQLLLANLYFKKGQKASALEILDRLANKHKGTVYGLSARSIARSIRSGRNYYQIFPPN
jgi:tetratricopeptide (TPR) repeat protein